MTCHGNWSSTRSGEISFTPPLDFDRNRGVSGADVDELMRLGLQRWFDDFETYLRTYASNWLFWLDKRWTRVLRAPASPDLDSPIPRVAA